MTHTRRGFFGRIAAALAAPVIAELPKPKPKPVGINPKGSTAGLPNRIAQAVRIDHGLCRVTKRFGLPSVEWRRFDELCDWGPKSSIRTLDVFRTEWRWRMVGDNEAEQHVFSHDSDAALIAMSGDAVRARAAEDLLALSAVVGPDLADEIMLLASRR